eukprot:ctg_1975.g481
MGQGTARDMAYVWSAPVRCAGLRWQSAAAAAHRICQVGRRVQAHRQAPRRVGVRAWSRVRYEHGEDSTQRGLFWLPDAPSVVPSPTVSVSAASAVSAAAGTVSPSPPWTDGATAAATAAASAKARAAVRPVQRDPLERRALAAATAGHFVHFAEPTAQRPAATSHAGGCDRRWPVVGCTVQGAVRGGSRQRRLYGAGFRGGVECAADARTGRVACALACQFDHRASAAHQRHPAGHVDRDTRLAGAQRVHFRPVGGAHAPTSRPCPPPAGAHGAVDSRPRHSLSDAACRAPQPGRHPAVRVVQLLRAARPARAGAVATQDRRDASYAHVQAPAR